MPIAWDELPDLAGGYAFGVGEALARIERDDPLAALPAGTLSAATVERLEAEVRNGARSG
jgi:hypothetical protein